MLRDNDTRKFNDPDGQVWQMFVLQNLIRATVPMISYSGKPQLSKHNLEIIPSAKK
jgi:hypothetical protein